jgi:Tfp pilus assembly protein PilO
MIAVLVFITVIILFIIVPTVNDIKNISNSIYQERIELEKKYLRGQLLKKTVSDFEAIKPQQDILDEIFIKDGEELKFVSILEDLADNNGVRQNLDLQIKNTEEKKGIKHIPLKITVSGNFHQVMGYLNDLQMLKYYFNISDLRITSDREMITATFSGLVFGRQLIEETN